jgi:hypothetical protein
VTRGVGVADLHRARECADDAGEHPLQTSLIVEQAAVELDPLGHIE